MIQSCRGGGGRGPAQHQQDAMAACFPLLLNCDLQPTGTTHKIDI